MKKKEKGHKKEKAQKKRRNAIKKRRPLKKREKERRDSATILLPHLCFKVAP